MQVQPRLRRGRRICLLKGAPPLSNSPRQGLVPLDPLFVAATPAKAAAASQAIDFGDIPARQHRTEGGERGKD